MSPAVARRYAILHRMAVWLSVAYIVALALIAFWPTPVDRGAHELITATLDGLHSRGAPGWMNYNLVEFSANIAMFLPVGLLGVILTGTRRWWIAILAGFSASCAIELGQLAFLPTRFATINDVVANTTGAAIGACLALLVYRGLAALAARELPARVPALPARHHPLVEPVETR